MGAIGNFKPTLWAKKILKDLDKQHMLVKNCTRKWSGEITAKGNKVKINSVLSPTIGDYEPGVTVITPETIKDESRLLEITESKFFAFELDDIDEKQANSGVMAEAIRKATVGLNDVAEQFIAAKYLDAGITITETDLDTSNIYSTLMDARTALRENNVGETTEVILEVTPDVYQKIVLADIVFTDNSKTAKSGKWSEVLGMMIYVSNNLEKTGRNSHCIMRTKDAIAYAEQINKVEKYRPPNGFKDAVKGLHLYGGKTVKPKEMAHLDLTTVDDTVV